MLPNIVQDSQSIEKEVHIEFHAPDGEHHWERIGATFTRVSIEGSEGIVEELAPRYQVVSG